ncbi:MAG: biotin/lipoyl-containing protein [Thermoleophilia bacterium]
MQRYVLEYAGAVHEAEVEQRGEGLYSVTVAGRNLEVDARLVESTVLSLIADGICHEVHFSKDRGAYTLLIGGEHYSVSARNRRVRAAFALGEVASVGRQIVSAPMAARAISVAVRAGDQVAVGDILVVLEAMKMENPLRSPVDGMVDEVSVLEGQVVVAGQKLVVVE